VLNRLVALTDHDIRYLREIIRVSRYDMFGNASTVLAKFDRAQRRTQVASNKEKGRNLQKWVCDKVAMLLGISWDNQDDESQIASRQMGQHGVDLILRGDAKRRFPWDIECKASKELRIADAVKQAEANTGEGRFGAVVYRQTGVDPVVVLSWRTFEELNRRFILKS
jgi:hypothetical protein